jgi:hypothetical protein
MREDGRARVLERAGRTGTQKSVAERSRQPLACRRHSPRRLLPRGAPLGEARDVTGLIRVLQPFQGSAASLNVRFAATRRSGAVESAVPSPMLGDTVWRAARRRGWP